MKIHRNSTSDLASVLRSSYSINLIYMQVLHYHLDAICLIGDFFQVRLRFIKESFRTDASGRFLWGAEGTELTLECICKSSSVK